MRTTEGRPEMQQPWKCVRRKTTLDKEKKGVSVNSSSLVVSVNVTLIYWPHEKIPSETFGKGFFHGQPSPESDPHCPHCTVLHRTSS